MATASAYPDALPTLTDVPATLAELPKHSTQHNVNNADTVAVATALGTKATFRGIWRFADNAARDAFLPSPTAGMVVSSGGQLQQNMNGTAAGWSVIASPVTTFTPTITQGSAVAATVTRAGYRWHGGGWTANLTVSFTASGTANNPITLTLPQTLANVYDIGGSWRFFDAGSTNYTGAVLPYSTTQVRFARSGFGAEFGNGDIAIASGDSMTISLDAT